MRRLFSLLLIVLMLSACAPRQNSYRPASYSSVAQSELIAASYQAADALITQAGESLSSRHPVIVATLVNINALEESSPLGRLISEQLGARLAQQGYKVIELKIRQKLYMKRHEGELMLTREIRDIAQQHNAQALIIGTYTEGADRVFINLKLTQIESNIALAAVDYALPLDMNIRALLYRSAAP
jgi:TolB-like protein